MYVLLKFAGLAGALALFLLLSISPILYICWLADRDTRRELEWIKESLLAHLPEGRREEALASIRKLAAAVFAVEICRRNPPTRITAMGDRLEAWKKEPEIVSFLSAFADCPKHSDFQKAALEYLSGKWYERDALRGTPPSGVHDFIWR